jgi:release factor glutamine methyltransferase
MRWLRRRARGEPVAYLTGRREFCALEFEVTPDVLVPRPETEILVEQTLAKPGLTVLELGTGSGCVAVALSMRFAVTATDNSPRALEVARRNAQRHHARVDFILGDLYEGVQRRFDIIASNPPYIRSAEFSTLPPEVRAEPRNSLDGGPDGLAIVRRIIAEAPEHLASGGHLLIEIGAGQAAEVCARFEQAGFAGIRTHRDLGGIERVVEGRAG